MRVTIHLPDDISAALEAQWDDVPRRSLEAIAIEAYRNRCLDRVSGAVTWRRLGLAEERLVPPEARRDIAYANDRPRTFHRMNSHETRHYRHSAIHHR